MKKISFVAAGALFEVVPPGCKVISSHKSEANSALRIVKAAMI